MIYIIYASFHVCGFHRDIDNLTRGTTAMEQ
jgi:hypothetical protein